MSQVDLQVSWLTLPDGAFRVPRPLLSNEFNRRVVCPYVNDKYVSKTYIV